MSNDFAKMIRLAAIVPVFIAAMWYSIVVVEPTGASEIAASALISLLVSFGLFGVILCIHDETSKYQPVVAPFLNRHLLKPQEKRGPERGRDEGWAQKRQASEAAMAGVRKRLEERGLNPEEFLPEEYIEVEV